MITPEQQRKLDEYLRGSGYTPPATAKPQPSGSSWYDAVQKKSSELSIKPTDTAEKSLTERVGTVLEEGADKIGEAKQRQARGEQTGIETGLQTFGTGLSTAGTVGFETIKSVPIVGNIIDKTISGISKNVSEGKGLVGEILQSDKAKNAIKGYQSLSERTKANMGALFEILTSFIGAGAGKAAQQPIKESVKDLTKGIIKEGSEVIEKRAFKQSGNELNNILELTSAKSTKKNVIEAAEAGRSTQTGALKKFDVAPSTRDLEIAKDVQGIVKGKNQNVAETLADINDAIPNISEKEVRPFLQKNPRAFNTQTVNSRLNSIEMPDLFKTDKVLENTYNLVRQRMIQAIEKNPKTMEGLRDARKEFDKIVKDQFGDAAFDSEKNTAIKRAIQDMRREVNNYIGDEIGDDTFKNQMRRISNLYDARYNLSEKFYDLKDTNELVRWIKENPKKTKALGLVGTTVGASGIWSLLKD